MRCKIKFELCLGSAGIKTISNEKMSMTMLRCFEVITQHPSTNKSIKIDIYIYFCF